MKKLITTVLALGISVISFAQVRVNDRVGPVPPKLTCNCSDLKVNVYLYKETGTTNYIVRLDYFNNKSNACTPTVNTLGIFRGGSESLIRVPLAELEKTSSRGVILYRIKPAQ
ncbi:hypothetical protein [Pedobacter sp. Leaf170]|uniref:hypothetical protein n=1 Tax=Pedobacter sp. Leaf170 TaxID=2876558 RepID=UPI001E659CB1|nr:hypothetical protein [Pedobacter sp. Leaf170]